VKKAFDALSPRITGMNHNTLPLTIEVLTNILEFIIEKAFDVIYLIQ
jgi:hypothetical protein